MPRCTDRAVEGPGDRTGHGNPSLGGELVETKIRAALEARIRAAKAAPEAINLELSALEAQAKTRIARLRGVLERNPEKARVAMGAVFEGP